MRAVSVRLCETAYCTLPLPASKQCKKHRAAACHYTVVSSATLFHACKVEFIIPPLVLVVKEKIRFKMHERKKYTSSSVVSSLTIWVIDDIVVPRELAEA